MENLVTSVYETPDYTFRYPGVEQYLIPDEEDYEDILTLPERFNTNKVQQLQQLDLSKYQMGSSSQNNETSSSSEGTFKSKYFDYLKSWEGQGYHKVKNDRGGATNTGITLGTWKTYGYDKNNDGKINEQDVKLINNTDWEKLMTDQFWNYCRADEIKNPYLASFLVDWAVVSGQGGGISRARQALGLSKSSKVDDQMLKILNEDPVGSFNKLKQAREAHYRNIARRDPSQAKFLNGWLRRVNSITLSSLTHNK